MSNDIDDLKWCHWFGINLRSSIEHDVRWSFDLTSFNDVKSIDDHQLMSNLLMIINDLPNQLMISNCARSIDHLELKIYQWWS